MATSTGGNHPASVLESTVLARTLTISDQHANLLLTTNKTADTKNPSTDEPTPDNEVNNTPQKALLKLTLVPVHKTELACLPVVSAHDDDDDKPLKKKQEEEKEKEHSNKVLSFLSKFDWRMTSESGAEYSFHEAFAKPTRATSDEDDNSKEPTMKKLKIEDSKTTCDESAAGITGKHNAVFKAELVYPASERQLARAMPSPGFAMILETPAIYQTVTKPFIDNIVSSGSLSWLQNIVEVKKEKERILWNAPGWILNIDTKWRTHPDALTVPRSDWFKHESTADLYCLGIFKQDGVATLRDLKAETHLSVLEEMLQQAPKVIEKVYGVPQDQLRIFVHYQPQFYHFHVHFTRLENDTGVQVEKAHLLMDIIQNLQTDPEYYQKRTMTYKLSLKDKLYRLIKDHDRKDKDDDPRPTTDQELGASGS